MQILEKKKPIRKAWKVWHEGMLSPDPNQGYEIEHLPITYAESKSEAKKNSKEVHDWNMPNGKHHKFTDLKIRRAPLADIMELDGPPVTRLQLLVQAEKYAKFQYRKMQLNKYGELVNFFIQKKDSFIGNCIEFWAIGGAGYTTNITEAQLYTKKEVQHRFLDMDTCIIWPEDHIREVSKSMVDCQNLNRLFKI
jgi:hypothetical protein